MNNKTFINFNCKRFKLNRCNERINRKLRAKYPFKISYLLSPPSLFTRQSQIKQCTYCLPPIPQDKTLLIYQDAAQIAPQNLLNCKQSAHSLHPKAWFWYFWEWHVLHNVLLVLNKLSYLPNGITSWASLTFQPQKQCPLHSHCSKITGMDWKNEWFKSFWKVSKNSWWKNQRCINLFSL